MSLTIINVSITQGGDIILLLIGDLLEMKCKPL